MLRPFLLVGPNLLFTRIEEMEGQTESRFFLLLVTALLVYNVIFFVSVKDVINLCIFDSILTFCGKKYDLSIFSYDWH